MSDTFLCFFRILIALLLVIPGCPVARKPLSGGSASLMAHGMAVKPGRSHQALLWTWEAQRNWALEATKNLQAHLQLMAQRLIELEMLETICTEGRGGRCCFSNLATSIYIYMIYFVSVAILAQGSRIKFPTVCSSVHPERVWRGCQPAGHSVEIVFAPDFPYAPAFRFGVHLKTPSLQRTFIFWLGGTISF